MYAFLCKGSNSNFFRVGIWAFSSELGLGSENCLRKIEMDGWGATPTLVVGWLVFPGCHVLPRGKSYQEDIIIYVLLPLKLATSFIF